MSKWIQGQVVEIIHWTDHLFTLRIDAPVSPFLPGQFTNLALNINGEMVQRAYSYVNAPHHNLLEFFIIRVDDGVLTPKLQQLKAGDNIAVMQQANGFFVIDEVPQCKDLWMMGTGTGICPYLSMLQTPNLLDRFEKIIVIHGVRYAAELSYLPLLENLKTLYAGRLHVQTIVSRECHETSLMGRIPRLIENGELEKKLGFTMTPEQSHVMLCGNPSMLTDTQTVLNRRGMTKHLRRKPGHITSETYW